jgi:hypothetical protein
VEKQDDSLDSVAGISGGIVGWWRGVEVGRRKGFWMGEVCSRARTRDEKEEVIRKLEVPVVRVGKVGIGP